MKIGTYFKIALSASMTVLVSITLLSCSRFEKLKGFEETRSTAGSTTDGDNSGMDSGSTPIISSTQKLNLPIALMSANQMLMSMLNATNVLPDNIIKADFGARYAMLADGNELDLVNPPLLLSATSIAGTVCLQTWEKERNIANFSERTVFRSFNFDASAKNITDEEFNAAVRRMAHLFWGRNENAEELKYLQEFRTEYMKDPVNAGLSKYGLWKYFASTLCATMLSSVDAITY